MGTHEENNMQQEIIDSLAKKVAELEKRQSKAEQTDLSAIPTKVEELEKKITEVAETRTLENTGQLERFDKQLSMFDAKINAIPKDIPITHRVQFDTKAKMIFRTILGLVIGVVILLAVNINLWIASINNAEERNKFLILRGFYPEIAIKIDSAYANNSDTLISVAKAKIQEQQTMAEAAIKAKQADEQSRQANDKLKKLKKKNRNSSH